MIDKYRYTETEKKMLYDSISIIIDTREKKNEHITKYFEAKNIPYKKKSLEQGDYSFYIPKNESLNIPRDMYFDRDIVIERKGSLEELATNLGKERARFEKELSIFQGAKVLLIENSSYEDVCLGNYDSDYNKNSFLGSLHSFWFKYNIPFVFMKCNKYSPVFIYAYFKYYLRDYLR